MVNGKSVNITFKNKPPPGGFLFIGKIKLDDVVIMSYTDFIETKRES